MIQSASGFSAPRVTPNQIHALGGVWRLTFRRFVGPTQAASFVAMLGLLCLVELAIVWEGRPRAFSEFGLELYLGFLLPVISFLSGAGAMRDDLKSGTVDYVLTRPVLRPAFIAFRFFCQLACVQAAGLIALGVMLGIANYRHIEGLAAVAPWLLLAQLITITAFLALGFFAGFLTSRFLIIGLAYGAVIEVGLGRIPTQLNRLSLTHQISALIGPLMPAAPPGLPLDQTALGTVTVVLTFAAVMVGMTMALFTLRELLGEHTREA